MKKSEQKCDNCKFKKNHSAEKYTILFCNKLREIKYENDWCAMWKKEKGEIK